MAEPKVPDSPEGMTVGELKEHIVYFTDLGGVHGENLGSGFMKAEAAQAAGEETSGGDR